MEAVPVEEQISTAFQHAYENPIGDEEPADEYKLTFTIAGKVYSTILHIKSSTNIEETRNDFTVTIYGKIKSWFYICLDIKVVTHYLEYIEPEEYYKNHYDTYIHANTPGRKCFDPVLVSNRNNPDPASRVTSTDVLMILKTKLQYLIPHAKTIPVTLIDVAEKHYVRLSLFNLLRKKDPIYKKYGFEYTTIAPFLAILPNVTWGEIRTEEVRKNPSYTFEEAVQDMLKETFPDSTLLQDILSRISFNQEDSFNQGLYEYAKTETMKLAEFSRTIVKILCKKYELPELDEELVAVHNPESPEWKAASDRLKFVSFEPNKAGGKHSRKTRNKRYKRKTRKSRKA